MIPISRNVVVARLATPDKTAGSVNNPVVREEDGIRFNDKWLYEHLVDDPSGMAQRVFYWMRYDLIATKVRANSSDVWRDDKTMIDELSGKSSRLAPHDPNANPAIEPSNQHRPVSDFKGELGLGGYLQSEEELREAKPIPAFARRES